MPVHSHLRRKIFAAGMVALVIALTIVSLTWTTTWATPAQGPNGQTVPGTIPGTLPTPGQVGLYFTPGGVLVNALNDFSMDILTFATNTQQMDGVEAYLRFDPTKLQVVSVTADTGKLGTVLANTFDNTAGTITYSAGTLSNPLPTGTFRVATITFHTLAATVPTKPGLLQITTPQNDNTPTFTWQPSFDLSFISWSTTAPNDTKVDLGGSNIVGPLFDGAAAIGPSATNGIDHYELQIDSGAFTPVGNVTTYTVGSGVADGSHTATVKGVDKDGNSGLTATAVSFTIDATGPTAPGSLQLTTPLNNSTPALTWTASADPSPGTGVAGYQLSLDGGAYSSIGNVTAYTFPSALGQGSHTVNVRATDNATNAGTPASVTFTLDSAAPTAPTGLARTTASNVNLPAFTWTASTDPAPSSGLAGYQARFDAAAFASIGNVTTFTAASALADGTHTFDIKAVDTATNASSVATLSFSIDTVGPAAPTNVQMTTPGNNNMPIFTWTAAVDPAPSSGIAFYEVKIDSGTYTNIGNSTSYGVSTVVADGTHSFTVKATDAAGNAGPANTPLSFTINTQAPPAPGSLQKTSADTVNTPTFTWAASAGASSYQVKLDSGTFADIGNVLTYTVAPALADGSHNIQVTAKNSFNNTSVQAILGFIVDTAAPTVPADVQKTSADTSATPTFTWSASTDAVSGVASYEVAIDAGAYVNVGNVLTYTNGVVADGSHTFNVRVKDNAGNTSASAPLTFRIDTVAPTAPTGLAKASPNNVNTPTFTWTASTDAGSGVASYQVKIDAGAFADIGNSTTFVVGAPLGDGGAHQIQVTAKDVSGNTSGIGSLTFTVDATAPTVPGGLAVGVANVNPPVFTWTASTDATTGVGSYEVSVDGGAYSNIGNLLTFTAASTLTNGPHGVAVRAKDNAGNYSAAASLSFVIDTVAPTTPGGVAKTSANNVAAPTFTWTASTDLGGTGIKSYQVRTDGTDPAPFTDVGNVLTYTAGSALTDSLTHKFEVRAQDNAGNVSTPGNMSTAVLLTFVVDATAPSAPGGILKTSADTVGTPTFTWNASTDATSGVAGYQVRIDKGVTQGTLVSLGNVTTYTSSFLADGTDYTIMVWAVDNAGNVSATAGNLTFTVNTGAIPAAPTANFTATPLSGAGPLTVQFTDTSPTTPSGVTPTGWSWNFGDGSPVSTLQNPSHVYTTGGSFPVALTVSNSAGTNTKTNVGYINVINAAFTGAPLSGAAPLAVSFLSGSSGTISSYAWDFQNDGTVDATTGNANFNYTSGGAYSVSLTVTGTAGSSTALKTNYVNVIKADFGYSPTLGPAPLTVQFTDASTGAVATRSWDFNGDATPDSIAVNPTFTYTVGGDYNASLTATGAAGSSTVTKQVRVIKANFTAAPMIGAAPLGVTFTDASTGTITGRAWDFQNDGVTDSTATSPLFSYTSGGTFAVKLSVTGPAGTDTTTKPGLIQVLNVDFSGTPTVGVAPLTVAFTDLTQGTVTGYAWDFQNDGTTDSVIQSPAFTYVVGGDYAVKLSVTGPAGTFSTTKANYVRAIKSNFTADKFGGAASLAVNFTSLSQGTITTYAWDFQNDGTNDSALQNPTFTYTSGGDYAVKLAVTGPAGSDTITKSNFIRVIKADLSATPTSGPAPLAATFTDLSSGTVIARFWDFNNDGVTDSTATGPSFTYSSAGIYSPRLVVVGPAGASQVVKTNMISAVQLPVANFTADVRIGSAPLAVQFTDQSTGNPTSWSWNFGDGSAVSTSQNPTHTYTVGGNFTVVLTVTNAVGSNTKTDVGFVEVIRAHFTASPTTGVAALAVTFTNASEGTVTANLWDFNGDSIFDSFVTSPTFTYAAPGTYSVTLMAIGPAGLATETQTSLITVYQAPVADFAALGFRYGVPGLIQFINLSSGNPTSYAWDFQNDGTTDSTAATPSFTYTTGGDYTVKLTVTNTGGSNTATKANFLQFVKAAFTAAPLTGNANVTSINFTDASEGTIAGRWWDLDGNGLIDTTVTNPSITYTTAGQKSPLLWVAGALGFDMAVRTNYITIAP